MNRVEKLLFGGVEFSEHEDYQRFQFRLLYALLWLGLFFSALFILANYLHINELGDLHEQNLKLYFGMCLLLLVLLFGRKQYLFHIAWLQEAVSLFMYLSALFLASNDQVRVIWLFLNLPPVYILLGRVAGVAITLFSLLCILWANHYIDPPYSDSSLTTSILALICTSICCYFYVERNKNLHFRLMEANQHLHELASVDTLSGLMNLRAYNLACDRLISGSLCSSSPFSVLFVDLDHFKSINDTYGHEVGDAVLRATALCLKQNVRQSDLVSRIGGEEFSIFLPNTNLQGALAVAEKLRGDIEALPLFAGEASIRLTASIGVAQSLPAHHRSLAEIQNQADQAMYRAKQQGRNRVSVFNALGI